MEREQDVNDELKKACDKFMKEMKKVMKEREGKRSGRVRFRNFAKLMQDFRSLPPVGQYDLRLCKIRRLLSLYPGIMLDLDVFLLDLVPFDSNVGRTFVNKLASTLPQHKCDKILGLLGQSRFLEILLLLSDHADLHDEFVRNFMKSLDSTEGEDDDHAKKERIAARSQDKKSGALNHVADHLVFKKLITPSYFYLPKRRRWPLSNNADGISTSVLNNECIIKSTKRVWNSIQEEEDDDGDDADGHDYNVGKDIPVYKCIDTEDKMFELDLKVGRYKSLATQIEGFLNATKHANLGIESSSDTSVEHYLTPVSIRCMKDLFARSGDDLIKFIKERGEEALHCVKEHLEMQEKKRSILKEQTQKLTSRKYLKRKR